MEIRCETGDIALVLYDEPECLENVGRLVRVHPLLMFNVRLRQRCWLIEPLDKSPWLYALNDGSIHQTTNALANHIEHPDSWLMPIRDNALTDEAMAVYERIQDQIDKNLVEIGAVGNFVK